MERLAFADARHSPTELAIHVARYSVVAEICRGRRVLDIACGEGFGSHLMVQRWGAASVCAVDVSAEALASARAHFDHPEVTWVEMDIDRLEPSRLGEPFDLIVSLETVEHVGSPEAFLTALRGLVRPGGTIVVSCPNDHWYYGAGRSKNAWHKHTWTFEEFRTLADGVLGPARGYLLGSTLGGFSNTRMSDGSAAPGTLLEGVDRLSVPSTLMVPNVPPRAPTPEQCLYYVGMWGPELPEQSGVFTPLSPHERFVVDHVRPSFVFQQRDKPRLVLVPDVPGWAFDNIAQQLRRHLSDMFEVTILYLADYDDTVACIHDIVMTHRPELVHFFWRESLFDILSGNPAAAVAQRYDVSKYEFLTHFSSTTITTSVYDHLFVEEEAIGRRAAFLCWTDAYSVSSEKLCQLYAVSGAPAPDVIIEDGVDLDLFRPKDRDAGDATDRALVIGWAGNSNWNRTDTCDPKGLHSLLKPALARLQAEGVHVVGHFIDSAERRVPREEMPAFYNAIDVYVCASEVEGTPNPVLEAMACGVPVISTDVGIVPQVFGPEQQRFMLKDRTVDAMVQALRALADDRGLRQRLSTENLARIKSWTWAHQMPKWLHLFRIASQRLDARAIQRKRSMYAFAEATFEGKERFLRRVIKETEQVAEARWAIMQKADREIADRDAVIAEGNVALEERDVALAGRERRIADLERDLAWARSGRGALRLLGDRARARLLGR